MWPAKSKVLRMVIEAICFMKYPRSGARIWSKRCYDVSTDVLNSVPFSLQPRLVRWKMTKSKWKLRPLEMSLKECCQQLQQHCFLWFSYETLSFWQVHLIIILFACSLSQALWATRGGVRHATWGVSTVVHCQGSVVALSSIFRHRSGKIGSDSGPREPYITGDTTCKIEIELNICVEFPSFELSLETFFWVRWVICQTFICFSKKRI